MIVNTPSSSAVDLPPGLTTFIDQVQSIMETCATSESASEPDNHLKKIALYQLQNPGKKIRSKLIYSLSMSIDTGKLDKIALWAASNELMHEATLIHDDIQDDDSVRRGQATLWKKFGVAQAINAGDFLLLLSVKPLIKLGAIEFIKLHNQTSFQLARGQAQEILQKESKLNLEDDFYVNCIENKTAALFSSLAKGVSQIHELSELKTKQIGEIFLKLGCIFQMQDDIVDLYGNKGRKSYGCDIKEGKISFLIHTHLLHHPEDKKVIFDLLSKPYNETTQEEIENLKTLFTQKKTLDSCVDHLKKEITALKRFAYETETFKDKKEVIDQFIFSVVNPIAHVFK